MRVIGPGALVTLEQAGGSGISVRVAWGSRDGVRRVRACGRGDGRSPPRCRRVRRPGGAVLPVAASRRAGNGWAGR